VTTEFNEWERVRKRLITSLELRNALAHFHVAWQIPGAPQNGTPGPTVEFAILQVSETGATIPADSSWVGPHPPGVHLLLRPNSANPNEKFKGPQPATKKPMKNSGYFECTKPLQLVGKRHQGIFGENPAAWNAEKYVMLASIRKCSSSGGSMTFTGSTRFAIKRTISVRCGGT
jgi:hypothetical protein